MKNRQHIMSILLVSAFACCLTSCNTTTENVTPNNTVIEKTELQKLYETTFNGNSIVIKGDTVINQKEIQLHNNPTIANIDAIKNANGTFKMVAIGGGLTAGARDGGLYRNGQLTSFPNLIAIQMKADFKQPLFAPNEANGYGYKVVSNVSNGIPKYKAVSNNIALLKSSPIVELNPYNGEIDNWGIPFVGRFGLKLDREFNTTTYTDLSNPYKTRFWKENIYQKSNVEFEITKRKFDFMIVELGFDFFISTILTNGYSTGNIYSLTQPSYITLMQYAKSINANVVIANIPDFMDLPIIKTVDINEIRKINQAELAVKTGSLPSDFIGVGSGSFMLPNKLSDSLLNKNIPVSLKRGLSYKNPLNGSEVYTTEKVQSLQNELESENKSIIYAANLINCPIVDINTLYKKIAKNDYTTNDGIKVTQQNFFSSDGIFPTAFGQAIIANEYIKTINSFYKTNIPLIQTAYYLNK